MQPNYHSSDPDKPENSEARGPGEYALLALLTGLAGASAFLLAWQAIDPRPVSCAGLTIDRRSAALTLLVAAVGAVTFRFSLRYLDGEPGQRRFLRWLGFTVAAAYLLMLSTNLLLLVAAWSLTSLGLHQLLTHYRDRPEARRPARKKFLISRLGDLALLAAVGLIWRQSGTLDLNGFLAQLPEAGTSLTVTAIGALVAVAALTKSAQLPFHSWLPETMESPTPVSALMHAGIINAGGALLLRFAPLVVRVPEALFLLTLVGTLTAALGMLAMWAQVKVKRVLAWSTVSQMGFMMIQCGLAAFPAALLHILGHGCYKARSFLRTGDLAGGKSSPSPVPPLRALVLAALGTALAVPALVLASWLTGFSPLHSPGELALSAVVALAVGQLWVGLLGRQSPDGHALPAAGMALMGTVGTPVAALALYRGAAAFLAPVLGDLPSPAGPLAWAAAALAVIALLVLVVVHALLPLLGAKPGGRALYVHALHGFYFGVVADRVVDQVWSRLIPVKKEVQRA